MGSSLRPIDVLGRDSIAYLSKPSDFTALWHLGFRILGECALFWLALLLAKSESLFFIPVFLICGVWHSFWGYAGIGHEFYHNRVFSYFWINQKLFRLASYMTLNNPFFFAESHSRHHRDTFADHDLEAFSLQHWDLRHIFCYLFFDFQLLFRRHFYVLANAAGYIPRKNGLQKKNKSEYRREALGLITFQLLVHIGLFLFTGWFLANLLWILLPATGLLPNRMLAQAQHIGLSEYRELGPLKHSRTLVLPWWLEFLYAGMNFHAEHHFLPGVPYYKLSELHKILVDRGLLRKVGVAEFFMRDFPGLVVAAQSRRRCAN